MIKAIKGMKDIEEKEAFLYKKIITVCEEIATNYGFYFVNLPHLEFTNLFKRTVGESSDIVGKEMYEFIDKGENEVCLRPEGTAGAVRAYIEHKFDKQGSIKKWFYHGSMFRYERPQKGRLREFHQFGVESFGEASAYEDANVILMLNEILQKLKIKAKLKINSLGCQNCMKDFREKLLFFLNSKEGFCDDCLRRLKLNPIRVLDCKNENCAKLIDKHPKMSECLCEECKKDFDLVKKVLKDNNLEYDLDDRLVRGLDYYSKTAFEFVSDEVGAKSSIAGGGRYDKLIEYLGGKKGYGVGFALGIERFMSILEKQEINEEEELVYLCSLDKLYIDELFKIAIRLRRNKKVFFSYEAKKIVKHLSNADNLKASIFLCMGENEAKNQSLFYKHLKKKEEKQILIKNLEYEL